MEQSIDWKVIGATARGYRHERTGDPNQDAFGIGLLPGGAGVYMAVSDGHGSRTCFRSEEGAKLAVLLLESLLQEQRTLQALKDSVPGMRRLTQELLKLWRGNVLGHLKRNPFRFEETESLDRNQRAVLGRNALVAYGATLLFVAAVGSDLYFFQLGDGDFLTMSGTGVVSGVFGADERLMGNATTSLCLPNAVEEFKLHHWKGDPPSLVMCSTDGYANSFRTEADFHKTLRDYGRLLEENPGSQVQKRMPGWLGETSRHGSGDDITVTLLYRNPTQERS